MDPQVVAALVGATVSVFAAFLSAARASRAQQITVRAEEDLAKLQAKLDVSKTHTQARIDYEYEARKRLYTAVEPLLFQLAERSKAAYSRIKQLAWISRSGKLYWLSDTGYYYMNTLYRLLSPLAVAELMRRRLTSVDLALDSNIYLQYRIAGTLVTAFGDDYDLARTEPMIDYDPDSSPSSHGDEEGNLPRIRAQGVYAGRLDSAINFLILASVEAEKPQIMTYGEFERRLAGVLPPEIASIRYLLINFDPALHGVLWRILVVQAHLYRALLAVHEARLLRKPVPNPPITWIEGKDQAQFHYRASEATASDPSVPFCPSWSPNSTWWKTWATSLQIRKRLQHDRSAIAFSERPQQCFSCC